MTKAHKHKELKEWGLALVIKGLAGSFHVILLHKMAKTIQKGDFVLVDKNSTGARLPI